jgi:hypothetical protein
MADSYDFTDSALMGHVVSIQLLAKLTEKGLITPADAADLLEEALLHLEQWQAHFPEYQAAYEVARQHLSDLIDAYRAKPQTPRE